MTSHAPEPQQAGSARTTPRRKASPALTLAAVCFGLFMVGLDSTVVHIANPAIQADLGASFTQLQWVINSYLLALAVFLVLGGKLGDAYGRKKMYLIGVALFGIASVAIGLAGSVEGVLVFRVLQGVSAALLMPQTIALLRAVFPREQFGMAVGIWGGVSSVAIAGGPLVSGLLVDHFSWEWVFYINAPIALIGFVFASKVLVENPRDREQRLDWAGVVLLAATLFFLVFAVVQAQTWGWTSGKTLGMFVLAAVLLSLFIAVQARVAQPLLPLDLFRSRAVTLGGLAFIANFFIILGATFLITLFLLNTLGNSEFKAGLMMLPMSAFSIPAAPLGAFLTSKMGPRKVVSLGLTLMAIGLLILTRTDLDSNYAVMAIGFVIIAFGSGFAIPSGADLIVGGAPVRLAGVASGFQSTCIQIGGAIGTAVLAAIVTAQVRPEVLGAGLDEEAVAGAAAGVRFDGAPQIADAFIGALHIGYVVCALLALVVAALVMTLVKDPQHHDVEEVLTETAEGMTGAPVG